MDRAAMRKCVLLLSALGAIAAALAAACGGPEEGIDQLTYGLSGASLPVASVKASADDGNVAGNAVDGNLATRWSCNGVGCWIRADLGAQKSVTGVSIAWYRGNERASTFTVALSTDDVAYTQVYAGESSGTTVQPE